MANRLMSAYGNLAQARTDIGRNLSDIAGIGIEMEYGLVLDMKKKQRLLNL